MNLIQSTQDPDRFFLQVSGEEIEFDCPELAHKLDDMRQRKFSESVGLDFDLEESR